MNTFYRREDRWWESIILMPRIFLLVFGTLINNELTIRSRVVKMYSFLRRSLVRKLSGACCK